MALSSRAQKLKDHAMGLLPTWYRDPDRDQEIDDAFAALFEQVHDKVEDWLVTQTRLSTATGATSAEPDWLAQHAADRGSYRQTGESDLTLRARLRDVPEALTINSLLAATQNIIDEQGVSGTPYLVELTNERAYFKTITCYPGGSGSLGVGVSIVVASAGLPDMKFKPHDGWDKSFDPLKDRPRDRSNSTIAFVTGLGNPGNSGVYTITGFDGDYALFENASGVSESTPGAGWCIEPRGADNQFLARYNVTGRKDAFMSRGYRMGTQQASIIIILPYGCDSATVASVQAMLTDKKAAGVKALVECRENP